MFTDPIDVVSAVLSYMDEEDCKHPGRAAKSVVDALTGAGLIATKPPNKTGNILIDQLRHDLQKAQADIAQLQQRVGPVEERQYGHALSWTCDNPDSRDHMTAYTEDGEAFAGLSACENGGWLLRCVGRPGRSWYHSKHVALGEAQRQYGKRFLP